jgi:hypothetical protein
MVVELAAQPDEPVSDAAIQYLNRLSDFLLWPAGRSMTTGRGMFSGARSEPLSADIRYTFLVFQFSRVDPDWRDY